MSDKKHILCFGELFIDMFAEITADKHILFHQHAGGSPGIVAYALAKYGENAYFVGKLSDDHFANFLVDAMEQVGVKMDYAIRSKEHRCTISFIRHDEQGEREFEIYRDSTKAADLAFEATDWQEQWFSDTAVIHCGSNCQINQASHDAHIKGLDIAQNTDTLISYDPNFRLAIWEDHDLMSARIHELFPYADLIKMSDDEAQFLFPGDDEQKIAAKLFAMRCKIMLITRGANGASLYHPHHPAIHLDAIKVDAVDTTGAGDNFVAAFLHSMVSADFHKGDLTNLSEEQLRDMIVFAHCAATLSVKQRGGMESSPKQQAVEEFIQKRLS